MDDPVSTRSHLDFHVADPERISVRYLGTVDAAVTQDARAALVAVEPCRWIGPLQPVGLSPVQMIRVFTGGQHSVESGNGI